MVEAPERWACEACFDTGLQADGETPCPCQDSRLPSLVRDLKRQIAELRAKVDVQRQSKEFAQRCCEKAEAENARLRALPLKDEVERVVERCTNLLDAAGKAIEEDGWDMYFTHVDGINTDHIGFSTDCDNAVSNARALLSRLRVGEQEGWRTVEDELPPINQVVLTRRASGYDGADVYAFGARVDAGEGWLWGDHAGYGGGIRPDEDAVWNSIEADDEYLVTHWAPLPAAPKQGEAK